MPLDASAGAGRRRHNILTWYAPSSPQTAGSHADPARRIRLAVHMADLDIAVNPVLRLAECPSGCGCDMGWRAANESAAASQKLSLHCPAKQPCPEPINPRILKSKTIAEGQDLLTTLPQKVSASSAQIAGCNVGATKSPSGCCCTSVLGSSRPMGC